MPEPRSTRPSLRLIAGELVTNLASDVADIAEAALTGRVPGEASQTGTAQVVTETGPPRLKIAVIGGGISGLASAWSMVRDRKLDADVTVFEASGEVGGKVKLHELEGLTLDAGAESMLAVRPEAISLARAVGLSASIVNPATSTASVVSHGHIRELPTGLISGVPTDLRSLAASDVLSVAGLLRIPLDYLLPQTVLHGDISIGDFVATRMGREVVDRLVEPMLGGVYAGRADELSLEMTVPALYRLAKREKSLLSAAREARATGAATSGARRSGPVFAGISGGVGRLPIALADRLAKHGVTIETMTTVSGLRRTTTGWRLLVQQGRQTERREFDAVVLAVPAFAAAKLLRKANPQAAAALDTVDYASVALVTMLYSPDAVPPTNGSGFLVPPVEGYAIKAATYSSHKWAWVARSGARGGRTSSRNRSGSRQSFAVVRASLGRFGEPEMLANDDADLSRLAARDLYRLAGIGPKPISSVVTRWNDSLPQYTVGHRGRMTRVREVLVDTPGIAVCGAAYDGVGIPACIGSAQFAAGQVATYLAERGQLAHG